MQGLYDLLRNVFAPESDWSRFLRKVLGVCLAATLGAAGWSFIFLPHYTETEDWEQPVSVVIERDPDKGKAVSRILQLIMDLDPNIRGVWLYSWPDARQLNPVMYVGESVSPITGESFQPGDEAAMGTFLFGRCAEVPRAYANVTCPINGLEDSWGVVTVSYGRNPEGEIPTQTRRAVSALVYRIGLILYSNDFHSDFID